MISEAGVMSLLAVGFGHTPDLSFTPGVSRSNGREPVPDR
jgi:hypothetical protein